MNTYIRSQEFHKRDRNEEELRWILNVMGVSSHPILGGNGEPDLMCVTSEEDGGLVFLVEVKTKRGKLSARQKIWHSQFPGPCFVARTPEDLRGVVQKVIDHYISAVKRITSAGD